MGNGISRRKKPPVDQRLYNIHGIQYVKETKESGPEKREEVVHNGVQGKLIREYSSVNGFTDIQWITQEYPIENIVMSGGGSKGYAYIGALKALDDGGLLAKVKRVSGSSAGAICAGMVAVGCSPQEVADIFAGDIKWLFHDQKCACCCCLPKICNRYGVHPAKRFNRIYGQHIAKKVGNPDITFGELYNKYGRELCIVVTNLSKMCSEYCHPKTTPDLPIRKAVRMSMSFPMVYQAVKANINGQESLYTDGGTLDQYPVHCFDGPDLELNHNTEKSKPSSGTPDINMKTLGLYVVSESAIDYKIWKALFGADIPYKPSYLPDTKLARQRLEEEFRRRCRKHKTLTMNEFLAELKAERSNHEPMFHYETCDKSAVDIRSFKEYFITTIETLLISQRRLHIRPEDAQRTVAINCGYIGTNDYLIEPGDREFMIRQGYECTRRFLQEYVAKHPNPAGTPTSNPPWETIHETETAETAETLETSVRLESPAKDKTDAEVRPSFHLNGDIPRATEIPRATDNPRATLTNGSTKIPRSTKSSYELKMEFLFGSDYEPKMKRTKSAVETIV